MPSDTSKKRGNGRVFRRGRLWWIAFYSDGQEVRESSDSEDKAVAEKKLHGRLKDVEENNHILRQDKVRFGELLDGVVRDYRINGRRDMKNLKIRVKRLRDVFGRVRAIRLTGRRIEQYKDSRLQEKAAPATVNRELAVIRRAYRLAVDQKVLGPNAVPKIVMLEEDNVREGFLEPEQFEGAAPSA